MMMKSILLLIIFKIVVQQLEESNILVSMVSMSIWNSRQKKRLPKVFTFSIIGNITVISPVYFSIEPIILFPSGREIIAKYLRLERYHEHFPEARDSGSNNH